VPSQSDCASRFHFDVFCWWTTDPATMFLTTSVTDMGEIPREVCLMIHRNEYLDADFNKFRVLARARTPAASLARATEGRPERSRRYRELLHPSGNEAELRASQVVDGACWGALGLYRKSRRPDFDDREADFLARLGPHLAAGLRKSLLAIAAGDEARPDASGLVVFDPEGRVTAVTASASRWLGQLHDSMGQLLPEHRVSDAIHGVAAVARNLDCRRSFAACACAHPPGHGRVASRARGQARARRPVDGMTAASTASQQGIDAEVGRGF
jgi:hypothetical protein